jgi:hypothetical protein
MPRSLPRPAASSRRVEFPAICGRAPAREGAWPADQVERWPIDRLIPYAKNSRTHSEAQIAQLAASMKEVPAGSEILEIEFDFISHRLIARTRRGEKRELPLEAQTVADFYRSVLDLMDGSGVAVANQDFLAIPIDGGSLLSKRAELRKGLPDCARGPTPIARSARVLFPGYSYCRHRQSLVPIGSSITHDRPA